MTFTDDEVKRLKEMVNSPNGEIVVKPTWNELAALLARLEAAEVLAECLSNHDDLDPAEVTQIGVWCKAAGK